MNPQRPQHLFSPTPASSQSSRRHVGQPPSLLTTTFAGPRPQDLRIPPGLQTPLPTTSLSTPFSAYSSAAYPLSSGGEAGGSSPMATRTRPTFNAPYNPQQWGPLHSSTSSPLEESSRTRHGSQSNRVARFAPRLLGPDGTKVV